METGEPPRQVCPGDPFARKYTPTRKTLDINDSRLYRGGNPDAEGTYIHHLCFKSGYRGFMDGDGYCKEDEGACPAQEEGSRMCTCRDRKQTDKALKREAGEMDKWKDGVERIRRGELLPLNS